MTEALTVDVVDSAGKKTGSVELPAEVFDAPLNIPLMHQVVVGQLAAPARARPAPRSSSAVAPSTARSRATTPSGPPRR